MDGGYIMSARYIFFDGVQYNPTTVDYEETKVGESSRKLNGTLRYYHRANKGKWTIKWTRVQEAISVALRTKALATGTIAFTDYDSTVYTTICLPGGFKRTLSAENIDGIGTKRYDCELVLDQS